MERLTGRNSDGGAFYKNCFREDKCRQQTTREKCVFCKHEYSYCEKLAAYEDAEEQGLLIRLPCKVGDIVYEANNFWNLILRRKVASVVICKNSIYVKNGCGDSFEFGKEVFLTSEEAEAALKRMG